MTKKRPWEKVKGLDHPIRCDECNGLFMGWRVGSGDDLCPECRLERVRLLEWGKS